MKLTKEEMNTVLQAVDILFSHLKKQIVEMAEPKLSDEEFYNLLTQDEDFCPTCGGSGEKGGELCKDCFATGIKKVN